MKWIQAISLYIRHLSLKERWALGVLWLIGLVVVNWPGQRITIGIFHSEGFGLLVPSLFGSLFNAMLFYGIVDHLIRTARPFKARLLIKTLIIFGGVTLLETLTDVGYYILWVGQLNGTLIKESLLTNGIIHFFFFYAPGLSYGIIKSALTSVDTESRIAVQDGRQVVYIAANDLLYLESDGNYVRFHQEDRVILERNTLVRAMERLPAQFIRCHKSYIINRDLIDQQSSSEVVIRGRNIPIGRKFKDNIRLD